MLIDLEEYKRNIFDSNLEDTIFGIDKLIEVSNEICTVLLESLKKSDNRYLISERISIVFDGYCSNLNILLNDKDPDLKFWAASLLVSYNICNIKAEDILLDAVAGDSLEKSMVATTILCRVKNNKVSQKISDRLKGKELTNEHKAFFLEKLEQSQLS